MIRCISFLEVWKKFLSSEMLGIYKLKLGLHVINQARVKNHLLGNSCYLIKKTRLAWLQLALPEDVSYILHKSCKICFFTCLLICMIEETRRAREKWNTCLNKTLTFEKYCSTLLYLKNKMLTTLLLTCKEKLILFLYIYHSVSIRILMFRHSNHKMFYCKQSKCHPLDDTYYW